MRALIGPKEDYCLPNMMLIIYANNKQPKGSLLFSHRTFSLYIYLFLSYYASTNRPKGRLLFG